MDSSYEIERQRQDERDAMERYYRDYEIRVERFIRDLDNKIYNSENFETIIEKILYDRK